VIFGTPPDRRNSVRTHGAKLLSSTWSTAGRPDRSQPTPVREAPPLPARRR
jgi:hypothetical protein